MKIYVKPLSCNGNGSFEKPFGSLVQVMEQIDLTKNQEDKVDVLLFEGKYHLEKPLVFNNYQNDKKTISFSAYEDAKVTISGSSILKTSEWKPYKDGIYVCNIEDELDFDVLYVNGEMQILARYPNYVEDEILNGYAEDAICPERTASWTHPETGYIRAIHEYGWGQNSYHIVGKDENNNLLYEWVGDHNQGNGMHKVKRLVENIFEELDAPGEWFYDKCEKKLYYYPKPDIDLQTATIEGASFDELINVINSKCNIVFEKIQFEHTHRTLFDSLYERPLRSDWAFVRKGAIRIQDSENVKINRCSFDHLGGNAVIITGYNKNHTINECKFTNIGASCILVAGLQKAVRDPSTWDPAPELSDVKMGGKCGNHKTTITDFEPGPKTEDYPRHIIISNNYMTNIGMFEKQCAGVCISIASRVTVIHNTIHHTPRAGISINDGTFGGHLISHNDIFDTVRETGDHGPFNSWGRDRYWSLNGFQHGFAYGKEKRPYALLDAVDTTTISNNRIHGKRGFGIDLDDGSTNYDIFNNLCLGVGIKCREGFLRRVHNNVIIGAPIDIHCTFAQNDDIYESNIVVNEKGISYAGGMSEDRTTRFINMMYYNCGKPIRFATEGVSEFPIEFMDPTVNDYRVKEDSQAITRYGFKNFSMKDEDFGCVGVPNSPIFVYVPKESKQQYEKVDGVTMCTVTDTERSAAASCDYDGLYIVKVDEGSPLKIYGFREGQILRKINDTSVKGFDDFFELYYSTKDKKTKEFTVYDNNQMIVLSL